MPLLATAFSILAAAAGVYYLLHPQPPLRGGSYRGHVLSRRRGHLRRAGGAAMLLLGVCFFVGSLKAAERFPAPALAAIWLLVILMLLVIVILAAIDVRLTYKIYCEQQEHNEP